MLAVVVMSAIGGLSAFFAWCAIRGVKQFNSKLLWRFFLWKAGRAFFFSLLLFSDVWKTIGTPVLGNYMMLFVVATGWRVRATNPFTKRPLDCKLHSDVFHVFNAAYRCGMFTMRCQTSGNNAFFFEALPPWLKAPVQ